MAKTVNLFGAIFPIEDATDGTNYIDLGTKKITVEKDDGGQYVMNEGTKFYFKGGRTRNFRKRRTRKYKK